MQSIAIIGAGDLGGALAHALALRDRIAEIRLIDTAGGPAAGKALDISQAGPIEGFRTRVTASADLAAARGAGVIVLADAAGPPAAEWQAESGLAVLKRLAATGEDAVFVCAGTRQRSLIERGVRELGIPRSRLIGSAPEAFAAAVRAMIALEADRSPSEVSVAVVGSPPAAPVVVWSEAAVTGHALTALLDPPRLARIKARLPHLWPPGPYTLASAASRVCEAVTGQSRAFFCCLLVLDGELGRRGAAGALPVRLGPTGIEQVQLPSLSVQERVLVENSLAT